MAVATLSGGVSGIENDLLRAACSARVETAPLQGVAVADPPYDDPIFVDAAVMLRLQARGVAWERDLLAVDSPALTADELHASLDRIRRREGMSWYPEEGRVLAPHPFSLDIRARSEPEQVAMRRAWADGNYWRGEGHPRYGVPGQAVAPSELERRALAEWRRAYDMTPSGSSRPSLDDYLPPLSSLRRRPR